MSYFKEEKRGIPHSTQNVSKLSPSCKTVENYLNRNGYHIGRIIGEGSYSKVRLTSRIAADGTTPQRLASKIIDKRKASEDFVTKFLPRELEIVRSLSHPNIVSVYDVVQFPDYVYIFMDYCPQGDLLEYVKNKGSIPEKTSQSYFRQLLSAVQYLHNQDLSHRDLKCENILMANHERIQISDFGFARSCRDEKGKRILSHTYCGSAAYAAPEILQGTHYNPKLYDMWSLGCVLYIMLTGHMPYDESNISRMLKHQLDGTLTYPSHVTHKVSDKAKACIRRILEPDVTKRPSIDRMIASEWVNLQFSPPASAISGKGDNHEASDVHNSSVPGMPTKSPRFPTGDNGKPPLPPTSGKKAERSSKAEQMPLRTRTPTTPTSRHPPRESNGNGETPRKSLPLIDSHQRNRVEVTKKGPLHFESTVRNGSEISRKPHSLRNPKPGHGHVSNSYVSNSHRPTSATTATTATAMPSASRGVPSTSRQ